MRLMAMPQNAPDALKAVSYMVDDIWYHAGDTSTDVSWDPCVLGRIDSCKSILFSFGITKHGWIQAGIKEGRVAGKI